MKIILPCLLAGVLFFCALSPFHAQTTFERFYGAPGARETGKSLVLTADGNLALLGSDAANRATDFYLLKLTPDGDTLWTRRYGGPDIEDPAALLHLPDGGFFLLGSTRSFGEGRDDAWLLRTDAQGAVLWTKTYGTLNRERGIGIVPDGLGNYWMAMTFNTITPPIESGTILYRLDANGAVLSEVSLFVPVYDIAPAPDGGVFYTFTSNIVGKIGPGGTSTWETDIAAISYTNLRVAPLADGGCAVSGRNLDFFRVTRFNASGDTLWTRNLHASNFLNSSAHHLVQLPNNGDIAVLYNQLVFDTSHLLISILDLATGAELNIPILNELVTNNEGFHIASDNAGNLYVAGNQKNGGTDVLAYKVGADLVPRWSKSYGAPGVLGVDQALTVTAASDGGFLLAGNTDRNDAESDFYYFKINAAGDVIWEKTLGETGSYDDITSSIATSDGGFVLLGYEENALTLLKTDAQGNVVWKKNSIPTLSTFGGLLQTADGGLLTAVTASLPSQQDATLIKFSASGDSLWRKDYGASTQDWAYDVVATPDNGYLLAGRTRVGGSFSVNGFLAKTDADGNTQWERNFGGFGTDRFTRAAVAANGSYLALGYRRISNQIPAAGWLVNVSPAGDSLWSRTFEGLGGPSDLGYYDVLPQTDGSCIVVASTTPADNDALARAGYLIRLDAAGEIVWERFFGAGKAPLFFAGAPGLNGGFALAGAAVNNGSTDVYFVRTNADGLVSFFTPPTDLPSPLALTPNPARGETWLTYDDAAYRGDLRITLLNAAGRVVRTRLDRKDADKFRVRLYRQGLPAGMYTVHVSGGGAHHAAQVVFID